MFIALDSKGQRVTLTNHQQAAQLRADTFFCPVCKQPVMIRNGPIRPAHFAHYNDAPAHGEPESTEHLLGKQWLMTWLEGYGHRPELEVYHPLIAQRADVELPQRKPPLALEFQASPIARETLLARTTGYQQAGLAVIWVMGERYFAFPGSRRQRQFLTPTSHGFQLWFLDVTNQRLIHRRFIDLDILIDTFSQASHRHQRVVLPQHLDKDAHTVAQASRNRHSAWGQLQQQAYQQRHNLAGLPWIAHQDLAALRVLGIPELYLRAKWLLLFGEHPIDRREEELFWQNVLPPLDTPLLPPGMLATWLGARWRRQLRNTGYVHQGQTKMHWLKPVHWFSDIDRKLAARPI